MRAEFDEITSSWTLISGMDDLTERIERAADWTKTNGPLEPDEQARIGLMIESQIARGMFPECHITMDDEDAQSGIEVPSTVARR